jgi:hypothetical protein
MKRNKLLLLSIYFFRFVQFCMIIFLLMSLILLIAYQVAPEKFSGTQFTPLEVDVRWMDLKIINSPDFEQRGSIALGKSFSVLLYLIYLQIITVFFLGWLVVREFKKVIYSLKQLHTFQDYNVEAFRKISKYFLVIFIISNFSFYMIGSEGYLTLALDIKFAVLAIASFILAEIFKEGNRLQEEHQLTV